MTTPEQCNPAGNRQIRAKGDRRRGLGVTQAQQNQPEYRAYQRRQQDGQRQYLPAAPGAEHRQQLEVAMAHAFLAGQQLEYPIHRPQAQITGDGAPQRIVQRGEHREVVGDQAQPEQGQHQDVGEYLVVGIDQAHGQQPA